MDEPKPKTRARKVSIFARRAYKHVNNFIRVHIHFRDGTEFPLTLDVNQTLEYVARQIEAEATIRNLDYVEAGVRPDDLSRAIDVYQLYDAANLAIPFSAKVGEALVFDDEIYPITSVDEEDSIEEEERVPFLKSEGSSFLLSISEPSREQSDSNAKTQEIEPQSPIATAFSVPADAARVALISTLEDRLDSVLHNIYALQFFNEFCLQEYTIENVLFWIEAEVFRSIADEACRNSFSKHIYNTYVKEGAPLALNVDRDIRKTVERCFADPQSDMFIELQAFIYILIKQAAYVRFESSHHFQNFLQFKKEDRYAYVQGKTIWDFGMLNKDHLLESVLSLEGDGEREVIYRQKVLLEVLGRYFPKLSSKMTKKYFDASERKELGAKHRHIHKQKKLAKFFGGQPGEEVMRHQQMETDSMSIISLTNSGRASERSAYSAAEVADVELKRKKAEKLTGFFGNQLPGRQMKRQGLQNDSSVPAAESAEVTAEEDREILGTVNRLTAEEKMALQKRAKKLLGLLGTSVDGKPLTPSQIVSINKYAAPSATPVSTFTLLSGSILPPHERHITGASDSSDQSGGDEPPNQKASQNDDPSLASESDSNLSLPMSSASSLSAVHTPQTFRAIQKSRLDKLSHVMGERISENQLKDYLEDSSIQPRPLTPSEKKILLRKNNKLERVFGGTVPATEVINYESLSQHNLLMTGGSTANGGRASNTPSIASDPQPAMSLGPAEEDRSGRTGEADAVHLSSSLGSLSTIPESKKVEEDRKARLLRLRKIKKMLGLNEGSSITIDALKQIQEAINNIVDDERDKRSLLEELEVEWRSSVAAGASNGPQLSPRNAASPSLQIQTAATQSQPQQQSPASPVSPKQGFSSLFSSSTPKASPRLEKRISKNDRPTATAASSSPKLEKRSSKTGQHH